MKLPNGQKAIGSWTRNDLTGNQESITIEEACNQSIHFGSLPKKGKFIHVCLRMTIMVT